MKRTFVKTIGKKFIPVLIIASALFAGSVQQAAARTGTPIEILSSDDSASLQYAGSTSDAYMFSIALSNPEADNFTLLVEDAEGNVLFAKNFSDKNFAKTIKLLKADDNSRYSFLIISKNKTLAHSFTVTTVTKTVDDVVVNKL